MKKHISNQIKMIQQYIDGENNNFKRQSLKYALIYLTSEKNMR